MDGGPIAPCMLRDVEFEFYFGRRYTHSCTGCSIIQSLKPKDTFKVFKYFA